MSKVTTTFEYGGRTVTMETGEIGRQASASIMIDVDGTTLMVTAVGRKEAVPGRDFFPMTVNYQEKIYAAGRIPGNFFRREGRPSEAETLTCRLIDRPLRPLFPKGFVNEVQIIAQVMSLNPEVDPEVVAILGSSAALAVSGMPFAGPVGAARVGYIGGEYVLNPSPEQLESSDLDLIVAGTDSAVLMVESEAKELSEEVMLGAVVFGHEASKITIAAIQEMADEVGNPAWDWTAPEKDEVLAEKVASIVETALTEAFQTADKMERYGKVDVAKADLLAQLCTGDDASSEEDVVDAFQSLEKKIVRSRVLAGEKRIDGRDPDTVRDITVSITKALFICSR